LACFLACDIKKLTKFQYDDACDVFGVHGTGGVVGCILTGIFADSTLVAEVSDSPIPGGWINGNVCAILFKFSENSTNIKNLLICFKVYPSCYSIAFCGCSCFVVFPIDVSYIAVNWFDTFPKTQALRRRRKNVNSRICCSSFFKTL